MLSTLISYPHLTKNQETEGEILLLEDTQIPVSYLIEDYHRLNQSVDAVIKKWNHLNPALILSALAYYYDHREEINQSLKSLENEAQQREAQNLYPDLATYEYMQRQGKLFEQLLPELRDQYEGYYVYFEEGQVLESNQNEEDLLDLIEEKYGLKPMFIEKVTKKVNV